MAESLIDQIIRRQTWLEKVGNRFSLFPSGMAQSR